MLIEKYLSEYRVDTSETEPLCPFTEDGVNRIGELSEYNAGKMLKMAYDLLDRAADIEGKVTINAEFVTDRRDMQGDTDGYGTIIESADSTDLVKKAKGHE